MTENDKKSKTAKKKLIGLTGNYCAGKNHVALLLEQRSIPVLDIDKLGHEVIEKEKERVLSRFGEDILGSDGLIERKRLGYKVFGKPNELSALEEIVHPAVNRETLTWIHGWGEKTCVINAALLHRSSAFQMLDAVIVVKAPFLVRLLRAKRRDRLPLTALLKRFRSQKGFDYQLIMAQNSVGFAPCSWKKRLKAVFSIKSKVVVPKTEVLGQPQLFKGKTDIYIVENSAFTGDKLEKHIEAILSDIFSTE